MEQVKANTVFSLTYDVEDKGARYFVVAHQRTKTDSVIELGRVDFDPVESCWRFWPFRNGASLPLSALQSIIDLVKMVEIEHLNQH
jgi:hypothetical protein